MKKKKMPPPSRPDPFKFIDYDRYFQQQQLFRVKRAAAEIKRCLLPQSHRSALLDRPSPRTVVVSKG